MNFQTHPSATSHVYGTHTHVSKRRVCVYVSHHLNHIPHIITYARLQHVLKYVTYSPRPAFTPNPLSSQLPPSPIPPLPYQPARGGANTAKDPDVSLELLQLVKHLHTTETSCNVVKVRQSKQKTATSLKSCTYTFRALVVASVVQRVQRCVMGGHIHKSK